MLWSERMYFPRGTVNDFEQDWFGGVLRRMREPVLEERPAPYFALRILVVPSWDPPALMRVEYDGTECTRRAVLMRGGTRKTRVDRTTELASEELAGLLARLDRSGYWHLPPSEQINGRDGTMVIVETVQAGGYRVRLRWGPELRSRQRGLSGFAAFYTEELFHAGVLFPGR